MTGVFVLSDPLTAFAQESKSSAGQAVSPPNKTSSLSDANTDGVSDSGKVTEADGSHNGQNEKGETATTPESEHAGGPADDSGGTAVTDAETSPPPSTSETGVVTYQPPPEDIPAEPIPTAMRRRIWGLQLGMGISFGGDDLVTAYYTDGSDETLDAGTGFYFTAGTTVTPLYFDGHAVGLGLEFGIKGWNIGGDDTDFQLNMTRLPLLLYGIYSYGVTDSIDLLAAGGMQLEFNPNMSGSGAMEDFDVDFDTAVGGYLEAGILFGTPYFAIDLTLRYTMISYTSDDIIDEIDGSNFGIFLRFHIGLLTTPKS